MWLFVNYARADREAVRELGEALRVQGHRVWVDEDEILMGQNYQARITQAIAYTEAFLYILSKASLASKDCTDAFRTAQRLKKRIIVVLIDEGLAIPREVAALHVHDLSRGKESAGFERLVEQLGAWRAPAPVAPIAEGPADVVTTPPAKKTQELVNPQPDILSDRAAGPDGLGFRDYAEAFAHIVTNPNIQPPLTIGIYGEWGTGKTFLMQRIMESVERQQTVKGRGWWRRKSESTSPRILQLDFDAWAYNTSEVLWATLVQKVFEKIEDQISGIERVSLTVRRNLARNGRRLLRQLFYFSLLALTIGFTLFVLLRALNLDVLATLVPLLGLPVLVRLTQDLIMILSTPQSRQIATLIAGSARARRERHFWLNVLEDQDERGSVAGVYDDMAEMLKELESNTRLAIFIDDLDRCKPERVVEVLEAINLLLAFKEFIIFLAIDPRVVAAIVDAQYAAGNYPVGTGAEYLEKIVQIPFSIPRAAAEDVVNYVNKLIAAPPGEVAAVIFPTPEPSAAPETALEAQAKVENVRSAQAQMADSGFGELMPAVDSDDGTALVEVGFSFSERSAFRAFGPYLDPNPRRIKRLVNVYRLVRILAERRQLSLVESEPAKAILWLLLCQQWPLAMAQVLRAFHARPQRGALTLAQVYEEVASPPLQTTRDKESTPDYEARVLKALIAQFGAALTADDIAALQGITLNFHPTLARELYEFLN